MACRTGCKTKDHASWGECARAADLKVSAIAPHNQEGYDRTKKELAAYRAARRDGIQPEGTTMDKIQAARRATENMKRPYNADVDPPASMVVNKKAGEFITRSES
jgi:hypothetical protein